jgi:hypothetical protein
MEVSKDGGGSVLVKSGCASRKGTGKAQEGSQCHIQASKSRVGVVGNRRLIASVECLVAAIAGVPL